ncbi:hypothetical protein [Polyangium mundeleinium]|uniref:Uncharacterized protein n=1 Tax=Polyangium mundeleinium TaxID=2995306 RepID=A0ABT5ETG5_9BACT|nr:hypothetical protein [Polyangium mundeleinium]MDC0744207.1 hypothetical protein [Polyangium mundeleinium]
MRWPLLVALFLVGCGPSPAASGAESYAGSMPASGRVMLHGVTVAPCKFGGDAWDGTEHIDPSQIDLFGNLLRGRVPYVEIAKALAAPANDALDKPDVKGRARTLGVSEGAPLVLKGQEDTFTPQFQGPPTFPNVAFDGSTRLAVDLLDDDTLNDDPIGSFQLGADEMLEAFRAGNVHQVRVDAQTNGQVLFAAISVLAD